MTRLVLFDGGGSACFPAGVVDSLHAGGMVIFPTDTLYGLGVDPRSEGGLRKLLALKDREGKKATPLLLDSTDRVSLWAERITAAGSRLMEKFWPGALTIILPARPDVPVGVTAGGGTVGLRVPDHPVPRALARALGGAITGTSANRAGIPENWGDAGEIVREFTGEVDWVLWDGASAAASAVSSAAGRSPGSTVVRVDDDDVTLLREGVIPFREIADFLKKG